MNVSRVIGTKDMILRHAARKSVAHVEGARATRGLQRSGKTAARVTPRSLWLNRQGKARTLPVIRSKDPENHATVHEETETETPEETNNSVKEEKVMAEEVESYSGPAAELLKKLRETDSEETDGVATELERELQRLFEEKTAAESRSADMESELEEAKAQYLRLSADFDNFRKRAEGEKDQLRTAAKGDVIETLLPLVDNFELARTQIKPQSESEEAIVNSFMGLYKQMVDLFAQLGVKPIDCDEKPFDPEFHDAIMRELNNDLPDGTVMEELRKGFTMKGKLLRPAMVKVSYSDEVLQETELPMDDMESTVELDKNESENNGQSEQSEESN